MKEFKSWAVIGKEPDNAKVDAKDKKEAARDSHRRL